MRKPIAGIWEVPAESVTTALITTAACFLLGGIVGCALAAKVDGAAADHLNTYINAFLALAGSNELELPALLPLLWETLRWPLITILLGFTALGLLGIPILFAVRGFLLAFAISSFARMLGSFGLLFAFFVFGVSSIVAVPALFVLGVQGWNASRCLAGNALGGGKSRSPYGSRYFLRCGMCAAAFTVCVMLEYLAVPSLVSAISGVLPG